MIQQKMKMRNAVALSAAIALFCFGNQANASWTVINLHPAGATESYAYGVHGNQQVGTARVSGEFRASLWTGSAGSWVNLSGSNDGALLYGVSGGQQVGGMVANAFLWHGTVQSAVNLHPYGQPGVGGYSWAYGTDGTFQVGEVIDAGGAYRASMWNGSASSWVNLHPSGAFSSYARGVHGGKQVGYAVVGGVRRASLWSGTAASWVSLHPAGATWSEAWGVHGSQQVGFAKVGGSDQASLWTGTAASWLSLHPAGATESRAYGVYAGKQVGYAVVGGVQRASLWSGTAASWVDLHQFLPAGFSSSEARGIWENPFFIYVVGWGFNTATNRNEALMWRKLKLTIRPTPPFSNPLPWWILPPGIRELLPAIWDLLPEVGREIPQKGM
jgi:hypothetical protein